MISYKLFEHCINEMKRTTRKMDEISNVTGWVDGLFDLSLNDTLIELMENMMGDTSGMISFWVYDMEFGDNWEEDTCTEQDGTPIICKTIRQLYDYMVKRMEENKNA